ncbi:PREDICTED: glycine-rich RNA-binding protein RZ1B isoform X2 [Tarenaya hassleriana]|nr:PREDICTED: glycine-rich RNA-binding protein RZ1B isoform X2 [Tarenaya hassleriana]XP_010534426.1 PREDICTED: glycine-rich RNA-binding protein RZ1B isoform X2 [Tarenaya hassleriana]
MVEKETGRSRGFGFITFSDRRGADDAIKHMHGREFGERVISVNKAEPKIGGDDLDHSQRGGAGYSSRGKVSYRGGAPAIAEDECFKCGRPGHWARDCPSIGAGQSGPRDLLSLRSRSGEFNGNGRRDHHFGDREHFWERDRYVDERYGGGTYNVRDRLERGDRYGRARDQYEFERYAVPPGDRLGGDRYGGSERYGGKVRGYERDSYARGMNDRYGGAARPTPRDEGRGQRARPGPYSRPSRAVERASSFDRW